MRLRHLAPRGIVAALAVLTIIQFAARPDEPVPNAITRLGDSRSDIKVIDITPGVMPRASTLGKALSAQCEYVMMFHPDCYWCDVHAPKWTGIDSVVIADGKKFPLKWLSLDPTVEKSQEFLAKHSIPAPGLAVASAREARLLGVYATPTLWFFRDAIVVSTAAGIDPKMEQPPSDCTDRAAAPRAIR